MFQHYLKSTWKQLLRYQGYTLINILGLAIGIACCLLITIYVQHEKSYDQYHSKKDRIYRVLHAYSFDGNERSQTPSPEDMQVWGNAPVGPALAADFPEIQQVVRFTSPARALFRYQDKRFQEDQILYMDSTAFEVFDWKLLAGDPSTVLAEPNTIVLTQAMARKYFGDENPIGKTLMVEERDLLTVSGVMENVPSNSHFHFEGLISMSTFQAIRPNIFDFWGYVDFYTYILLEPGASIDKLSANTAAFLERHSEIKGYNMAFEALPDVYLHSMAGRQPGVTGSLTNLYIFSFIALFILLLACINFINLATARSTERAKEVGVRKVVGGQTGMLVGQFLMESLTISLIASVLALMMAYFGLPVMESISGKLLNQNIFSGSIVALTLGIAVIVGMLAGFYPALVLTRFRPALVLRGAFGAGSEGLFIRKGLVVFQFSLSITLIIGAIIIFSQLKHLLNSDLGFQKEQMIVLNLGYGEEIGAYINTIKQAFEDHPKVISTTASRAVPGESVNGELVNAYTEIQSADGNMMGNNPYLFEIDEDFVDHFQLEMVAGRSYATAFPADTISSLVINESAAKLYGYHDPKEIIGKSFSQWGREGKIIGVVKDFNFRSLHQKIEPLTLRRAPFFMFYRLTLRVHTDNLAATLLDFEKLWAKVSPQQPFLYSFLDDTIAAQYQSDYRFSQLFTIFAGLAIFIACLGLLGLATFAAKQRTKEIGIRKILGASVGYIIRLLSWDFLKLVFLALLIASPVAWYVMNQWLNNFAYRIAIPWWVFVLAGGIAAMIAIITISIQSFRAAIANPIHALRDE